MNCECRVEIEHGGMAEIVQCSLCESAPRLNDALVDLVYSVGLYLDGKGTYDTVLSPALLVAKRALKTDFQTEFRGAWEDLKAEEE